jgi:UDP-glucose:(heptosyl)LPS alpha-1,3-glucosyltransferase
LPETVHLAVVGNKAHAGGFAADIATWGLQGRVHFLGALPDVTPAYTAADVLAHPTLEDTFAMVVLEAMAHGLPVVVSAARYCGIAGLLSHRANAFLLDDPQDSAALIATLGDLLTCPVQANAMGEAAAEFASQHRWMDIASQQHRLYDKVIREKECHQSTIK